MFEPFHVLDTQMYNPFIYIPVIAGIVAILCLITLMFTKHGEYSDVQFMITLIVVCLGLMAVLVCFLTVDENKSASNRTNLEKWKQSVYVEWLHSLPQKTYKVINVDHELNTITYIDEDSSVTKVKFRDDILVVNTPSEISSVTLVTPPKVDIDDIAVFESSGLRVNNFYFDLDKLTLSGREPVPIYLGADYE